MAVHPDPAPPIVRITQDQLDYLVMRVACQLELVVGGAGRNVSQDYRASNAPVVPTTNQIVQGNPRRRVLMFSATTAADVYVSPDPEMTHGQGVLVSQSLDPLVFRRELDYALATVPWYCSSAMPSTCYVIELIDTLDRSELLSCLAAQPSPSPPLEPRPPPWSGPTGGGSGSSLMFRPGSRLP